MIAKDSLMFAFLVAAMAAASIYEYTPRKVDAGVLSTGARSADGRVLSRFIDTDKGRAPIGMDQEEQFPYGQKVNCVLSHDFLFHPSLHDCKPK
jgi:hypothetical protein